MNPQPRVIANELQSIVGAEHVREAEPPYPPGVVMPLLLVEPGSAEELALVLRAARDAQVAVLPRGGGTKLEWGNAPRSAALVLSTRRLDRVIDHAWADMTATVEAGCTVARLQETLAQHGQRLALDPLWPERATIGGILATNDSGTLRVRFGALRDLILGVMVALPDGTLAKSGGRVVKNVAGYDLPKLFTGSLGTLGVIIQATFRLYPLPRETHSLSFSLEDVAAANRLMLAVLDSPLAPTGLQLRVAGESSPQLDVRFEGVAAAAQMRRLLALAGDAEHTEAALEVWALRESLWQGQEPGLVCKFSVLPADLAAVCEEIRRVAGRLRLRWSVIAQAVGVGLLRLEGPNQEALAAALGVLRAEFEARAGSLVLLHTPPDFHGRIDVWGDPGDALPLMRRVKEQFDPAGILNPGRFVGGL
ncbi:MAG: glycolate oxidase [Herpetosiphonaceae bacterium]|nr:MAG: glycolate oxidase [Herpetosiphonaceae bacterium]